MAIVIEVPRAEEWLVPKRKRSRLTISRNAKTGPSEPEFKYDFSINEYVVTSQNDDEPIEFELHPEPEAKPTGVSSMYIYDYCCSRVDAMTAVKWWGAQGEVQSGFGPQTTGVAFKPSLGRRELINIGLIVAIQKQGSTEIELILCDPQVGNGPPASQPVADPLHTGLKLLSFPSPA